MDKKQKKVVLAVMLVILFSMTACKSKPVTDSETTKELTATPIPTVTVTPTPTGVGEETGEETAEEISSEDAVKQILKVIGERGYYIELVNDTLDIGGDTYYEFQISDSSQVIAPNVLVDKVTGKLLCYQADGSTAEFSEHPLYTASGNNSENSDFTKEDALKKLSKLSAKTLELPKDINTYTIIFDDWPTLVEKLECYGINVYEDMGDRMSFKGTYFVAMDGSKIFLRDSVADKFIELKE